MPGTHRDLNAVRSPVVGSGDVVTNLAANIALACLFVICSQSGVTGTGRASGAERGSVWQQATSTWRDLNIVSTSIVLLVLAAGWCAYLAVWFKDARRAAARGNDAIRTFSSGMGTLGGSSSGSSALASLRAIELKPRSVGAAAQRRRQVLTVLGALAVVTFLAALVVGAVGVLVHLLADAALLGYAYAVVQRRNLHAEREMKVEMLYPEGVTPMHAARRTVNG